MRKIKFRAWDKTEETMIPEYMKFYENGEIYFAYVALPKDLVVMQYTGLKDKNGKEIYDGDVVDIPNFKENWKRGEPQGNWRRFKIEWNKYLFAFNNEWIYKPLADYDTSDLMPYEIEVIGNIYENPDLLSPTKDLID